VIIDLGCGDGRAVLATAAAEPGSLIIGIDAAPAAMAESSRRAARSAKKGGLSNAVFLAAGAGALDGVLDASADLVTVLFPWGSLLEGVLGLDRIIADVIARLVKPGGRLLLLLSITPRDGVPGLACFDELALAEVAGRWRGRGFELCDARLASMTELRASGSTWARRLAAGQDRQAWRLEFAKPARFASRRHDSIPADDAPTSLRRIP
jgi:16S rRNA (adenine(1408)-N(1))-methyltransferase